MQSIKPQPCKPRRWGISNQRMRERHTVYSWPSHQTGRWRAPRQKNFEGAQKWFIAGFIFFCLLIALCLFHVYLLTCSKCKRKDIALRVRPSLSLCFPTLLPSDHHYSLESLPCLARKGCHESIPMERTFRMITYHAVGKNTGFGGSGTYFSCMLLAWLLIVYVPQLSRMWNGDSIVVKGSFL